MLQDRFIGKKNHLNGYDWYRAVVGGATAQIVTACVTGIQAMQDRVSSVTVKAVVFAVRDPL